ncbi:hypothetical protein [Nostoc sp.]|uniref:hypothetical protein n=1 Tax=Nostoc sp. TaxID=1180 RepID=UPI002FFCC580
MKPQLRLTQASQLGQKLFFVSIFILWIFRSFGNVELLVNAVLVMSSMDCTHAKHMM